MDLVVTYRKHPKTIVTIDGEQYIPLKDFCAMTGLRPDDVTASTEAQGQIIERPPEGRQRKPRQYITVKAWLALYERVFGLWLAERSTGIEYEGLVEYGDDGVKTQPWRWYGIDKIVEMFDIRDTTMDAWDAGKIWERLILRDYVQGSGQVGEPLTVEGLWANDRAKETGWVRNHMRRPSPCERWHIFIVLDIAHPEFAKLLADIKNWPVGAAKTAIGYALVNETAKRNIKWRMQNGESITSRVVEARKHKLLDSAVYNALIEGMVRRGAA